MNRFKNLSLLVGGGIAGMFIGATAGVFITKYIIWLSNILFG